MSEVVLSIQKEGNLSSTKPLRPFIQVDSPQRLDQKSILAGRSEKCFKLFNFQSAGLREDNLTIQAVSASTYTAQGTADFSLRPPKGREVHADWKSIRGRRLVNVTNSSELRGA